MNENYSKSSRFPGFTNANRAHRIDIVSEFSHLNQEDKETLKTNSSLPLNLSNMFIENNIGSFSLPLGIATNFLINNEDYIVPHGC